MEFAAVDDDAPVTLPQMGTPLEDGDGRETGVVTSSVIGLEGDVVMAQGYVSSLYAGKDREVIISGSGRTGRIVTVPGVGI